MQFILNFNDKKIYAIDSFYFRFIRIRFVNFLILEKKKTEQNKKQVQHYEESKFNLVTEKQNNFFSDK